ncbi:hypothetical protein ACFXA8_16440, partial [Streptomyces sp. NPDC059409]
MSTEKFERGLAPGALLLCRAEPDAVAAVAPLLGERMPLLRAGEGWSVIVPEGGPWRDGGEPVDRVVTGWAAALAVGAPWPVLALWWDADRAGYTLASGFRRPVGYVWLANGTPVGEDEAMRTFAARGGVGAGGGGVGGGGGFWWGPGGGPGGTRPPTGLGWPPRGGAGPRTP